MFIIYCIVFSTLVYLISFMVSISVFLNNMLYIDTSVLFMGEIKCSHIISYVYINEHKSCGWLLMFLVTIWYLIIFLKFVSRFINECIVQYRCTNNYYKHESINE